MSGWALLLGAAVAVVLATASLAVAPSRASAYWSPTTVSGTEVEGWFNSAGTFTGRYISKANFTIMARDAAAGAQYSGVGTPPSGYTSSEITAGQATYDALKATTSTASQAVFVRQAMGSELTLMQQVKSWGALKTLGNVGMALGTFSLGWEIGGKISDLFFQGTPEEVIPPGSHLWIGINQVPRSPLDSICADVLGINVGACSAGSSTVVPYPFGGFVTEQKETSSGTKVLHAWPNIFAESEGCNPAETYLDQAVGQIFVTAGKVTNSAGCTANGKKAYSYEKGAYVDPLEVEKLPGTGVKTEAPHATRTTTAPTPVSAPVAVEKAEECLRSKYCEGLAGYLPHHDPRLETAVQVAPGYPADATIPDAGKVTVPSPAVGETYAVYIARLEALELIGSAQVLAESAIDTSKGPEEVTSTSPAAGTQVAPGSTVAVRYNPATAPAASALADCDATIDSVDLSPLNAPVGEKFPFGIFVFFVDWVGSWTTSVSAPEFDFPLAGSLVLHVDFGVMAPLMGPVRLAIIFASFVGLLWFLGTAALRLNGDGS